jgi:anti-anti-sigma regulatory factor
LQLLVAACRDADACLVQPSAALRETLELCGLGHLLMGTRP